MSKRVDVVAEGRILAFWLLQENIAGEIHPDSHLTATALCDEVERLRDLVLDLKSDIEWRINKERD